MPQTVAHIFGGEAKVKIMRLFIFNPSSVFSAKDVATKAKVSSIKTRKELRTLLKASLIKKRGNMFVLNKSYRYLAAISDFLIDANPLSEKEIGKRIGNTGSIKLILLSGVFIHNPEARVDVLVVGDHIKQGKLLAVMSSIEAELGKELRYAVFDTTEFQYRLGIYDKLVRDILDTQHEKVIDKFGLEPRQIAIHKAEYN